MMRRAIPFILIVLFSASAQSADDLKRLSVQLGSSKLDVAKATLEKLLAAGDEGREIAKTSLQSLLPRSIKKLNTAAKQLDSTIPLLKRPKTLEKIAAQMELLEKASEDLYSYAMSDETYAVPAKAKTGWTPGKDYQKGQVPVEGRVEVAIEIFNKLEADLIKGFGKKAKAPKTAGGGRYAAAYKKGELKDPGRAIPVLTYAITDSVSQWEKAASSLKKKGDRYAKALAEYSFLLSAATQVGVTAEDELIPADKLAVSAVALFAGNYDLASENMPDQTTAKGKLFDALVDRHIMILNTSRTKTWGRTGAAILRILNLYRISIGARPVLGNLKLYKACKEHSDWQNTHKKMSHSRPEASHKSFVQRGKLQGYPKPSSENISAINGVGAMWAWRADAGHHRNLISKKWMAVGIAETGKYVTYNTGRILENEGLEKVYR